LVKGGEVEVKRLEDGPFDDALQLFDAGTRVFQALNDVSSYTKT
jgi:hypothetical protein